MGVTRKVLSVATAGLIDFRSDNDLRKQLRTDLATEKKAESA